MVRVVRKILGTPVPLMVISPADLQSVLDRQKISHKFFDGCLLTDPSLEDFALTGQESAVAAEVDEMPWVLRYIEDHKLESLLSSVPHPTSPPQDTTLEAQVSSASLTPNTSAPKTGKRAENNARWELVKNAARLLWAQDGALLITDVARRIQEMPHLKVSALSTNAIHKKIAHLAPGKDSSKSGRRPKKSP